MNEYEITRVWNRAWAPCGQASLMGRFNNIVIIIIRRFIKRRSPAEAEGKGVVYVFKVLAVIIRMFKIM